METKTKIIIAMIIEIIFFISLCSAIYPGETSNISIGVQYYHNYTVTNNLSYIPVNISLDNSTATISIPTSYDPGTFTITFYGERDVQEVVVNNRTYTSGGGGLCLNNWTCTEWSTCVNGNQTRNCTKQNKYCYLKPTTLIQNCTEVIVLAPVNQTEVIVPRVVKRPLWQVIAAISVVILAVVLLFYFIFRSPKVQDPVNKDI